MSGWNETRVARLKELWAAGHSAAVIAARLGDFEHTADLGRSAVIGKVHRMGLSGRATTTRKITSTRHTPAGKLKPKGGQWPKRPAKVKAEPAPAKPAVPRDIVAGRLAPEPLPPPQSADIPRVLNVLGLDENHCRWPIDHSGGTGFCGCNKLQGLPYCESHATRAFNARQPAKPAPAQATPNWFGAKTLSIVKVGVYS